MAHLIDKNLVINNQVNENGIIYRNVRNSPFEIYGLYKPQRQEPFSRMSEEVAKQVNNGVARLNQYAAGGRVRFCTDSKYVAIKTSQPVFSNMSHMALISSAGFDIYIDNEEYSDSRYYDTFKPSTGMKDGFEAKIEFPNRQKRYLTLNFPSYSAVADLEIGLEATAFCGEGLKYKAISPIVYYGSSITQGACSSRPGNAYPNIICRHTNIDFINLGFSGSALGEPIMAEYLSQLEMSLFVCDFDHNTSCAKRLEEKALPFYLKFREKAPNVPYLMISRPDYHNQRYDENILRRDAVYSAYKYAREHGDDKVFFLDGSSFFRDADSDMCTVDTTHPNDYGFYLMAKAIESEFRWIWAVNSHK